MARRRGIDSNNFLNFLFFIFITFAFATTILVEDHYLALKEVIILMHCAVVFGTLQNIPLNSRQLKFVMIVFIFITFCLAAYILETINPFDYQPFKATQIESKNPVAFRLCFLNSVYYHYFLLKILDHIFLKLLLFFQ